MDTKLPRPLLRRLENPTFPMISLQAIRETRAWLEQLEITTICNARDLGAAVADIADTLGVSRQSVYRKLQAAAEAEPSE